VTVAERPTIPVERYADRLARASAAAAAHGVDALLAGVGADLRYLTGYVAVPQERLTMLVVRGAERPVLIVPRLEALPGRGSAAAAAGLVDVVAWQETDDPVALVAAHVPDGAVELAVSDRLWPMFLLRLEDAIPDARFSVATPIMRELRIRKDPDEIALLRLAAQAADRVVGQIAAGRLVGRTEADVARDVRERLVAEGHDQTTFAIVASGPNSASPHHEAGDRIIRPGEPLVLDIGGPLGGYGSDITRTLWVTGGDPDRAPDADFRHLYGVLQGAQEEATGAVRPGVAAEQIDAVARGMIEAAGYGEQFIHRTGHGIGLEGHEDPYLVRGSGEALEAGMAFSVEPGIYFPGQYGARIEDIVACGPDGPIELNEAPRELYVVDG